jgi:tripartite motif-containing protein 71
MNLTADAPWMWVKARTRGWRKLDVSHCIQTMSWSVSLVVLGLLSACNYLGPQQLPVAQQQQPDSDVRFVFSINRADEALLSPLAVTESAAGDIYVADSGHSVVQVFDHEGAFLHTIGQPAHDRPPGEGELIYPAGLALDADDRLYVADVQAGRISVFSPEGDFVGTVGDDVVSGPVGLVYQAGQLIVNDIGAQQVLWLDPKGAVVDRRGGDEAMGLLAYANYSALSPDGQLAIADSNNNRVVVFSSQGELSATLSIAGDEALLMPRGIGYDAKGRLHIVSVFRHQVFVFDRSLAFAFAYGEGGDGQGQFNFPNGLWISDERIYVADRGNNRVQVWQLIDT